MTVPNPARRNRMPAWKKDKARAMRKTPTSTESILWGHLRLRRLGVKFRRQAPMYGYIADFYSPEAALVIEVDGAGHDPEYDAIRDAALARNDLRTVRIPAALVWDDIEAALEIIRRAIR